MSFATLEEAWGVSSFAASRPSQPAQSRMPSPSQPVPRVASKRMARQQTKSPEFIAPTDDVELQNVQRALARAYTRFGPGFVARLLPPEARHDLGLHAGKRRHGLGAWLRKMLRSPETMVFVLVAVLVLFWAWDSFSSSRSAPSLASLHMSPFSLGTSA